MEVPAAVATVSLMPSTAMRRDWMTATATAVPSTAAPAPVMARPSPAGSRRSAAVTTWITNSPTITTRPTEARTERLRPT